LLERQGLDPSHEIHLVALREEVSLMQEAGGQTRGLLEQVHLREHGDAKIGTDRVVDNVACRTQDGCAGSRASFAH